MTPKEPYSRRLILRAVAYLCAIGSLNLAHRNLTSQLRQWRSPRLIMQSLTAPGTQSHLTRGSIAKLFQ